MTRATGSAGTQPCLLAGLLALEHPAKVIGIDVDAQPKRLLADVCRVGRGATEDAIRLGVRLEGLVLDPVYTGKALAGLVVIFFSLVSHRSLPSRRSGGGPE